MPSRKRRNWTRKRAPRIEAPPTVAEFEELPAAFTTPMPVTDAEGRQLPGTRNYNFGDDGTLFRTARVRMEGESEDRFADLLGIRHRDRSKKFPRPINWVKLQWSYYTRAQWEGLEEDLPHKDDIRSAGMSGERELIKCLGKIEIVDHRTLNGPVQVEFFNRSDPYQLEIDLSDEDTMFYRAEYDRERREWSRAPWSSECGKCSRPYKPESTSDEDIMHFCPKCSAWYHRTCQLPATSRKRTRSDLAQDDEDTRGKELEENLLPEGKRQRREITREEIPDPPSIVPPEAIDREFVRVARQSIIRGGETHGVVGIGAATIKSRDVLDMARSGKCTANAVTEAKFGSFISEQRGDDLELPGAFVEGFIAIYCPNGHAI